MFPGLQPPGAAPGPMLPSQQVPMDPNAPVIPDIGKSVISPQHFVAARRKLDPVKEGAEDAELLTVAQQRFRKVVEHESAWRRRAIEELDFLGLKHWAQEMLDERKGRPCLVFDRITPAIDQVVNDTRQNMPEAKVSAVGEGADKDTAQIIQGMLRNIDQDSRGSVVWMTAYDWAVKIGRGWVRVHLDYEDDDSFLQKLVLLRVRNPFAVYPDPSSEEPDYSDMKWCFVTEDMDKPDFKAIYGDQTVSGALDYTGIGDEIRNDWYPNGAIRVAEYWWTEMQPATLVILANGWKGFATDIPPELREVEVYTTRKVQKCKVYGAKITGHDVLERWSWDGRYLPFIGVTGRLLYRERRFEYQGMTRPSMDANLQYDFMRSKEAEAIGLAPISQWLVAAGQTEEFSTIWADANRKAYSVLPYKPLSYEGGQPVPPPIRVSPSPDIGAIVAAVAHAENDIKATSQVFDPSLGSVGPEQSGRAILARQRQGDTAHYHYRDTLLRSMEFGARVELDLVPYVYSEERAVTIFDPDGSYQRVHINKPFQDPKEGREKIFRIGKSLSPARYDVTVGTGPSYASRRAQAGDQMMQLAQSMPGPMSRALDLVVTALDVPDADKLAERLRPPDIQNQQDGQQQIPPQVQQQMAQQHQMIQLLTERLNALSQQAENKKLELESKEKIAAMQAQVQLAVADLKVGSANATALMEQQFGAIKHQIDLMQARFEAVQQAQQQTQQAQPPSAGGPSPASGPTPRPESAPAPPAAEPTVPGPTQ